MIVDNLYFCITGCTNNHEIKNGLVLHSFPMEKKSIFNFAIVISRVLLGRGSTLFFVKTMFVRTLWLRFLKNYEHAKNMAEIAKILRTFQPRGKYLKTFPKSIAFSANF